MDFVHIPAALLKLNVFSIYDADPRPTFIVDTTAVTVDYGAFRLAYINRALDQRKDILALLSETRIVPSLFRDWYSSIHSHERYYSYGGASWCGFVVDDRWKIVSIVDSPSFLTSRSAQPGSSYSASPLTLNTGDSSVEYGAFRATTSRSEDGISLQDFDGKQCANGHSQFVTSVQQLRDAIQSRHSESPRPSSKRKLIVEKTAPAEDVQTSDDGHRSMVSTHSASTGYEDTRSKHVLAKHSLPLRTTGQDDTVLSFSKFQQLSEMIDVGFFEYHPSGKLMYANDSWYALSSHPRNPEDHTPLSFTNCVYPDDLDMVMNKWKTLLEGRPVTFEMRWKRPKSVSKTNQSDGVMEPSYDGLWVLSACVPVLDEATGAVRSITGCTTNISAQKEKAASLLQRAEALERARSSEERFARFAEVAPIAIFRFDKNRNIEYCNDRWFETTGLPKQRFEDIAWPFGVLDDDVEKCTQAWEKAIEEKGVGTIDFRLKKEWHDVLGRRGQTWVYCNFFPEFTDDGSFTGLMGSLLDISALKWAENAQKIRAEEALEAKRQQENFIDITSHEMRNPLSAMVQSADTVMSSLVELAAIMTRGSYSSNKHEMLRMKEQIATSTDAIETILSCAAHQRRIVDDILTLSKLDSNLLLITPVRTDPQQLVQDVMRMFQMDAQKDGVELALELGPSFQQYDVEWLMLDPSRVLQVLINLVTNALKFTRSEEKRKVTVRVSVSLDSPSKHDNAIDYIPAETVTDDFGVGGDWGLGESIFLGFKVQDTGRGLTPQEKAKLFRRFSQASPKTHVQYGGSGLGLFISRKLTEMQGGEIGFASEANVGSTFAFYVKTRRAMLSPSTISSLRRLSSDGEIPGLPKKIADRHLKVLLVEDNLVNQKVLSNQLRKLGCTVFPAGHGAEALDILRTTDLWVKDNGSELQHEDRPTTPLSLDIVLMDIEMPVMGGLECTRQIRHFEGQGRLRKRLPIISISANARQEQVGEARKAGVDDTITKPFRIVELLPKLNRLMD